MRSRRRARHASEGGLTLIELIVTLFLMTLGVVAMLGLFSTIVIATRSTDASAQLASQMRQVQDFIESENLPYRQCGSVAAYDADAQSARGPGGALNGVPPSYSVHVIGLQQASGGTHTVASVPSQNLSPINGCVGSAADYGVQQLEVSVSDSLSHSLKRIVYKRWN